ncbi:MAG TPA: glycine cleavage system aminomethyltransferase GcvT [Thermoplasmata archaeon]|nr:glycine cleavage system aminomethyltransferase GcvT [Thermoplasmata archaeon]
MTEVAPPADGPTPPLRRTPLFEFHRRHGAHLVPFSGWEMPLYYDSILSEHRAVREGVGLFDVSHMGLFTVDGGHAADLLGRRTTANVPALAPGEARYAFLLEATGKIVDDLFVTRIDEGTDLTRSYYVVPNAGRADEVEEILRQHRGPDTTIHRWNGKAALLAVQGPRSRALLEAEFGWDLSGLAFHHAAWFPQAPGPAPAPGRLGPLVPAGLATDLLVSRAGYTGELGFEVLVPADRAEAIAERLVARGAVPTGLGARDTLRLEKGFLLSGQDFHRDRSPIEAGQDRFVSFDHVFVGRPALEKERADGPAERLVGIEVTADGAIPRHGTPIHAPGGVVTQATSGGPSPGLGHGIALAYLPRALAVPGTEVSLDLRGRAVPGRVVALPFVKTRPTRP